MLNKFLFLASALILSSCATKGKCGDAVKRENSVFNPSTCQVYIRQGFYIDQASPEISEKAKSGGDLEFNWVPSKTTGSGVVPAHPEILIKEGG